MAGSTLFMHINNAIMTPLIKLGEPSTHAYMTGVSLLMMAAVTLYVLWAGYQTLAGKMQTPIQDVAWNLVRFGIIISFINNYDGYLTAAIDAMNGLKAGFAGGGVSVWAQLDTMWDTTQRLANELYKLDESKYFKGEGIVALILVWAGSLCVMLLGGITFLVADITMLFMTITAPIFLFCLMFGFLRTMFNNWLQIIFSSILTVMFASLVINVGIEYMNGNLSEVLKMASQSNLITMGASSFAAAVFTAAMVMVAKTIAGQIAGVSAEAAVSGIAIAGAALAGAAAMKTGKAGIQMGKGLAKGASGSEDKSTSMPEAVGSAAGKGLSAGYMASVAAGKRAVENMKARFP